MIIVYVCTTFSIVEQETRFETCIARNYVNGVYSFHVQIICAIFNTYKLYVNEYTPFTSLSSIPDYNRVFISTTLNVGQTYTNNNISTVCEIKSLFASSN
jgi:hypothetical protein